VKRLAAALAGIAGIAWLKRRRTAEPASDPAADLRAKIAEARDAVDDRDAFESGEKPVDEVPDDVGTRRSDVHDRARAAMDELSSDD
jgi:hypothetical protein